MNKDEKIIMRHFEEGIDRIKRLFLLALTKTDEDVAEQMAEELTSLINKAWRQGYEAGTLSKEKQK